jgi:hypothetical protein
VAIGWAGFAVLGIVLGHIGRRMALTELSLGVLGVASARVLLLESFDTFESHEGGTLWAGLVLSRWMAACLALCGTCILAAMVVPGRMASRATHSAMGTWIGRGAAALGVLLAMVAALHPDSLGASVAIAWMLLGIVAIMFAPLRPGLWLEGLGIVVLASMLARLLLVDGMLGLPKDGIAWHGLFLTRWCLAMSMGGGAWLLAGLVLSFRAGKARVHERMPGVASAAGLFMLGAGLIHPEAAMTSVLWAWIALATIALVASPLRRDMKLSWSSACGCLACLILWLVAYVAPGLDWTGSRYVLLVHPGLWSALSLAALMVAIAARGLTDLPTQRLAIVRTAAGWLAACLVLAATSLEVARVGAAMTGDRTVQLAFVSIWWAIFSVVLILAGFRADVGAARRAGLTLMVVATLKVVLYDMGGVPPVWRIASFLLLGLLMIGIAAGYSRVANRLSPRKSN